MFYSHTFLHRKSPLGMVWIAAHLERRIKKSDIDAFNVASSVDYIMFPEVPIALRLSGHLLLGVVRIYSRKVEYFSLECNRVLTYLRTAFSSVQLNLPEDADRAPLESVTLPDTFELDAFELDDTLDRMDGLDNHLKTYEQITMTDQIPVEGDSYVAFFINEDNLLDPPDHPELPNLGSGPMEEDVLPPYNGHLEDIVTQVDNSFDVRDHGTSHQAEGSVQSFNEGHLPQESPDIEVMRDALHNFEPKNLPEWGNTFNDSGEVHEHSDYTMRRKDSLSPILEGLSVSGAESLPSPLHANAPTVASADDLEIFNTRVSLGQPLPDLALQPSPHVEKQRAKSRKRKQLFDESLVLTNEAIRKQLQDTTKLVCKRRKLPDSALDAWRFHNTSQNEQIFDQPLLSGMCTELQEVFKRKFPQSADSVPLEASPGPMNARPRATMPNMEMEPEQPRCDSHINGSLPAMPDMDMEPEQPRFDSPIERSIPDLMTSPWREEFTSFHPSNLGTVSPIGKTIESLPTLEVPALAEPVVPEPETPSVHLKEQRHPEDMDLPGLLNSTEEDLNSLEAASTPARNRASGVFHGYEASEFRNVSARTRKTAIYLKEHSPATQISEDQSGNLSLNRILEGKTRKKCARTFFDTLVLKDCELINVHQEEAYGDILITPTPAFADIVARWKKEDENRKWETLLQK